MTALFMPAVFSAEGGTVLFEGRRIPDFRAIAVRHRLTSEALDPTTGERASNVFWALRQQLATAISEARIQRRSALRVVSTNPHPQPAITGRATA